MKFKFKLTRRLIIISIIVIIVLGVGGYFLFKNNGEKLILEKVAYGAVKKEVSETGTVKASEEADLSFKYTGRIQGIYVEVGDVIKTGQVLAKQDTLDISIQLAESKAALEVAKAKKDNAQVSLNNSRQSLKDTKTGAEEDLKNAYENALTALDDAYLKLNNACNDVNSIQRTYFTSNDQESTNVKEENSAIKRDLDGLKPYIDSAKTGFQKDIDSALLSAKNALSETKDSLDIIRTMSETVSYRDVVSSANKTILDNHKSYINIEYSDTVSAAQTVSTVKITNESNINTAQAEIDTLESQLKEGGLYQSQINQAEASILLLQNKIQEASLFSPANGQITELNKRAGETVQSTEKVISFLPVAPFKIEVDIYEEDIVNVKVGDLVKINLVAFSEETLMGRVVSIDPAERLIDGVVYYKVNIDFQEVKKGMKVGMTADIVIETAQKDNVLVVSKRAVEKIKGKNIAKVMAGDKVEEREIEIGLEGNEFIEVISGLKEGEEVVIR